VAFSENFKTDWKMTFPYKTISNTRVTSKFMSEKYNSNYFVLLDKKRVSHVEISINTVKTNFLIEKRLSPERGYSSYTAAKNDLKRKLIVRLKDVGNKSLFNLKTSEYEKVGDFHNYSKVYFVISECSACELKSIISDLKLKRILDKPKTILIFPVYANDAQLLDIIKNEKINFPIYIDYNDEFDLFSIITNPKDKLIVIQPEEVNNE
jgi:hypothetical protein